jgi:hypothetical protein
MKKATPLSRVIDIFSTAPPEQLDQLLDAAKQITRNRRERQAPRKRRTEPPADPGKES